MSCQAAPGEAQARSQVPSNQGAGMMDFSQSVPSKNTFVYGLSGHGLMTIKAKSAITRVTLARKMGQVASSRPSQGDLEWHRSWLFYRPPYPILHNFQGIKVLTILQRIINYKNTRGK